MNGGIDQLVDTYKGNPQPLAQKVQKAQQSQPPGEVPPDLEEAMALQKIAELRNSAQGQQAMQAGGAQQSVVEKLRQMLGGMQQQGQMAQAPQQGQMQGQPVMAASGGSIDQLISNLGRHYAGGGIVAFNEGDRVEDKERLTEEEARDIMRRMRQRTDMRPESMAITDGDFSSIPGFVAGNRFQQEMDKASGKQTPMTPQQMEANVKPAPREETQREPYSGPQQYTLQQQGADYVARKQAAREAKVREDAENEARRQALVSQIPTGGPTAPASTGRMPGELERNLSNTLAAMPGASVRKAFSGSGIRGLMGLLGIAGDREEKPAAEPVRGGRTTMANDPRLGNLDVTPTGPGAPAAPAPKPPALPRPPAANINAPAAPAKPAEEATDPMEVALRKSIMDTLAKDPEEVRRRAIEANKQAMGLDALLKPAQDRAAAREARIKEIQSSRQPLWIDALMSANKPTRSGVAGVLQNMAVGAISGKQNYDAEDLKFLDELNKLNSEIDKARIEGRYKDVAAGKDAVKDLISEKKQSESSGASLLNTKENVRSREQIAADNRAARALTVAGQAQTAALAREEKIRQFNEEQLRKLRQNDVDLANKIEAAIARRTGQIDLQLQGMKLKPEEEAALLARRNAIVKQVRAEYPSARPEKPSESQFLAAARAANPGVSDADLKAYYKQNYGS
jgi:hypothetical protein